MFLDFLHHLMLPKPCVFRNIRGRIKSKDMILPTAILRSNFHSFSASYLMYFILFLPTHSSLY
jgi:hypothetical protein